MRNENRLSVTKERRAYLVTEIKNYFLTEREEEIGDLAAGFFLDFILEKMAPEFYNQGIQDAQIYMRDAAEDLLSLQK